jgi:hypothetical protein
LQKQDRDANATSSVQNPAFPSPAANADASEVVHSEEVMGTVAKM